jgi:hypothetical protein
MERSKILPLLGIELQPLSPAAHSQSLYQLCYPGSVQHSVRYIADVDQNIMKILDDEFSD